MRTGTVLILVTVAVMATAANITLPLKLPDAEGLYVLGLKWLFNESALAISANLTLGGEMPMYGLVASIIRLDNTTLGFNITAYAPVWHAAELHWPLAVLWNNVGGYVTVVELLYAEEYGLVRLHVAGTINVSKAAEVARSSGAPDGSARALAELVSKQCKAVGQGAVGIMIDLTSGYAAVSGNGTWSSSGDVKCVKELYVRALPAIATLIRNATSNALPTFIADLLDPAMQVATVAVTLPENASFGLAVTVEDVPGGIRVAPQFELYEEGSAGSARPAEDYTWLYAVAALAAAGAAVALTHVYLRRRET